MLVLAYHSLEDRMVKERFSRLVADRGAGHVPAGFPRAERNPLTCVAHPAAAPAVGRPRSRPNPRAASARLRAVERLR